MLSFGFIPCFAWQQEMDKNNVRVFSREIPNSNIREYRAITVIDAGPEVIIEVFRDIPSAPRWMPNCVSSKEIGRKNNYNLMLYLILGVPGPISDRDLLLYARIKYDQNNAVATIQLNSIKEPIVPFNKKYVRMTEFEGYYTFEYIGKNKTKAVYTLKTDPMFSIPAFIINSSLKDGAHYTLVKMREMVKDKRYIIAGENSPDKRLMDGILKDKKKVKNVITARLKEYIKDTDVDEMVAENMNIVDTIFRNNGSYEGFKTAFMMGCEIYLLEKYKKDIQAVKEAINNNEYEKQVVDIIFYGNGADELPVEKTINKRLKSY